MAQEIRFLNESEILGIVNPLLIESQMSPLNTDAARVLGVFEDGILLKSLTIQLYPFLGPLLSHIPLKSDGAITRDLVQRMEDFLKEQNARGMICIADSPFTERLCERYGMYHVDSPVFVSGEFNR